MKQRHLFGNGSVFVLTIACLLTSASSLLGVEGRIVVPEVTGRPEVRVFAGHPGSVDLFEKGYGKSVSARIGTDGTFTVPEPKTPVCLILMFDRIETPPVIVPRWPVQSGHYDVVVPCEYACLPPEYPNQRDEDATQAHNFYQSFVPRGTQLYGVTVFDGPKIPDWGNQVTVMMHKDKPGKYPIPLSGQTSPDPGWEGILDRVSTEKDNGPTLRMGWRHGDMPVDPGQTYVLQIEGHRSHSGKHYKTNMFIRPDHGDGYAGGRALAGDEPIEGDLCCLVFSNADGQLVENQIRSEEWEIFVPGHRPARNWGQSFISHGVSLAGVSFWASCGDAKSVMCEVRIREEGPWGKMLKPAKIARGVPSPVRPIIRYPDTPAPLPGHEAYYKLPCQLFQVAYMPDELKLDPGKTYYVEVIPSQPLMMFADGERYQDGYAYYEGLEVRRQAGGQATKHSKRWTLTMNIVTYAEPGGRPLSASEAVTNRIRVPQLVGLDVSQRR